MLEQPKFLQGIFPFKGNGLDSPQPFSTPATYKVPFDKRAQFIYFRGGNSTAELIYVVIMRAGKPMRYFPLGAKESVHVPLAVVEDLEPDTAMELYVAAPAGISGVAVLDVGVMEF